MKNPIVLKYSEKLSFCTLRRDVTKITCASTPANTLGGSPFQTLIFKLFCFFLVRTLGSARD